ncbi:MAG: hypothetical protein ACJ77N_16560, partial [Chloroflexota bacterium]
GRYKVLMFVSLLMLAVALFLMTNLTAETPRSVLWFWMIIAGIGIGPSFAVFTLIVQNAVSPDRVGVATSSLTFFQQIGGTVGLTIAGTIFASRLTTEIPVQLTASGVPPQITTAFQAGASSGALDLTGTGDLGQRILSATPEQFRAVVEPVIPNIVHGIHEAFAIALGSTFWVGIVGALLAAVLVLFLQEVRMRETFEVEEPAPDAAVPAV